MCMAYEMKCSCGARSASLHFRDNILPEQVITSLHCPACSGNMVVDAGSMVSDNGWVITYNMEVAKFMGQRSIHSPITPNMLFDEGYCTWNGMYPGDHIDSVKERGMILALAKTDPKEYLKQLKTWANERMGRLQNEGWRKAKNGA